MILALMAVQLVLAAPLAPIGGGCLEGETRECQMAGCALALQECVPRSTGTFWARCACVIQSCSATPCVSAEISLGENGWECVRSPKTGTLCGNGNSCSGSETCDAGGNCVQGPPKVVHSTIAPASYDFCDAAGVVQHAPVAGAISAQPTGIVYSAPATPGNPLAFSMPRMPAIGAPFVNEHKGTLEYDYAFDLPKARGKFQPSLGLGYSSATTANEGVGAGWSLSAYYIEAEPAVPGILTGTFFGSIAMPQVKWWLRMGQSRRRLLPISGSSDHYQTDLQGQFVSIVTSTGGTWSAIDSVGSTYSFGHHVSRAAANGTGRYYLDSVVDVDGNRTAFNYADSGWSR